MKTELAFKFPVVITALISIGVVIGTCLTFFRMKVEYHLFPKAQYTVQTNANWGGNFNIYRKL